MPARRKPRPFPATSFAAAYGPKENEALQPVAQQEDAIAPRAADVLASAEGGASQQDADKCAADRMINLPSAALPLPAAAILIDVAARSAAPTSEDKIVGENPTRRNFGAVAESVRELQTLNVAAARATFESHCAFANKLAGAKSFSEAIALQTAHLRQQYDSAAAHWKGLTAAAQRLATVGAAASIEPLSNALEDVKRS